ncbi:hypothetical protein Drorol1_Dr00024927 [Drosera rotundifolia]
MDSGYMPPEYAIDGHFSVKSDVFSFGVMLLEIVRGKRNRGFNHPDHFHNLIGHAIDFLDKLLLYDHQDRLTAKEAMGFENGERREGETRGGNGGKGRSGRRWAAVWLVAESRPGEEEKGKLTREKEKAEVNGLGATWNDLLH